LNSYRFEKIKHKHQYKEYPLVLRVPLLVYKTIFSSQDGQTCMFSPSCSVYAIAAIKSRGIIQGYLMTMDRLLRCNGGSNEPYETIEESGLYNDPVH
jgi:putative membrane protein insertion efficiency factor